MLRASNGKTIEVLNTDAEGRLILADGMVYARNQGATHLVDIATLTGAIVTALGKITTGVFGNNQAWTDELLDAFTWAGSPAVSVTRVKPLPLSLWNSSGRPQR